MNLFRQQPLNINEKYNIETALNNLIKIYGEDSCIKICMDTSQPQRSTVFSGRLIQYDTDKNVRLRIKLNQYIVNAMEHLLAIYMDSSKEYYPDKKEWEDLINSEDTMFTLNDWLLMLKEYG